MTIPLYPPYRAGSILTINAPKSDFTHAGDAQELNLGCDTSSANIPSILHEIPVICDARGGDFDLDVKSYTSFFLCSSDQTEGLR